MRDNLESYLAAAKGGEMAAFARLLTLIERTGPAVLSHLELLKPAHFAFRIGITGPPGSGKSTLIGEILKQLNSTNLRVGVVAVDPSSPITHGAILGDRIRYSEYSLNPRFFIRSLGTRGSLGGLSSAAYLMLRAFDACDFDVVLVETVGVGQVEVEVMNVADYVAVVLVPESGDSIQAMKAGIIEIADLFIINKKDRPGADILKREIEASVLMSENAKVVDVLMTSATQSSGIKEMTDHFFVKKDLLDWQSTRNSAHRLKEEAKALLRAKLELEAARQVAGIQSLDDLLQVLNSCTAE